METLIYAFFALIALAIVAVAIIAMFGVAPYVAIPVALFLLYRLGRN